MLPKDMCITPEQQAQIDRFVKMHHQQQMKKLRANVCPNWEKQFSCDYTIVSRHYASPNIYLRWNEVIALFDLVKWGDASRHWDIKDCCAIRQIDRENNIKIELFDSYKPVDFSGLFFIIPTSCIPERSIDSRLQAFSNQSRIPPRVRLKEIDIPTYCKHFEQYAQPIRSHNESEREWEYRLLTMFLAIANYVKTNPTP